MARKPAEGRFILKAALFAGVVLPLLAGGAFAGETPGAETGITVYPPAFFASAQPTTALDMVKRLPGFVYDSGDSVRGFAGSASNVLIDGARPTSKIDNTDSMLGRIPAGDVDHVELIRGGAPGIDMQGRTVLANVVRKKGDRTEVIGRVNDNLFLGTGHTIPGGALQITSRIGEREIEGQVTRYMGLDDSVGNGTIDTLTPGAPDLHETARTTASGGGAGVTGSYSGPDLGGILRVNVKIEESYFHQGVSYGDPPDTTINDRNRQRDGEIGFNYERKMGQWDLQLIGLQHLERDSTREWSNAPGDIYYDNQNQRSGESIGRVVLRYEPGPALSFEGGGEMVYNYLYGDELYIDNDARVLLPSDNVFVSERRGEMFGQAAWKVLPTLRVEVGLKLEYSNITESGDVVNNRSFFYPKPRLLLTWDPLASTQVRLRVERKVGQLNFSNFVSAVDLNTGGLVSAGNPNIRPDDHWQYEAAVEQRFWDKGSVVVTALHEQIADVNDYVPIPGGSSPVDGPGNIGSGTSDQLDIEGNIPLDRLGVKGGLLKTTTIWRVSSVKDPITHEDRRISGQRPNTLQAEYDQDLPQWKSTITLTWFKGWHETNYRIGEIDRYHVGPQYMELGWTYKPTPDLTIRVEDDNLLPFKYYRSRTVWDGVRSFSPVDYDEYRTIHSQPRLFVRVRKVLM